MKKKNTLSHDEEHEYWSRRNFLKTLGVTGTGMMLGGNMMAMPFSKLNRLLSNSLGDRVLVLIRLNGGNDGLNTFVPLFDYSTYSSLRPNLALPTSGLYNLDAGIGMHQQMGSAYNMWQQGSMKVLQGVGYENQSLSHFRSTDIWDTASDASVVDDSGWLGRHLEDLYPDFNTNPPSVPAAIKIGSNGDMMFNNSGGMDMAFSVANPDQLLEVAENGTLYDLTSSSNCFYDDQVYYLKTVANSIYNYAEEIGNSYNASSNSMSANYPTNGLGPQLALVARMIKGNLGTKLFLVSHGSYDTHASQLNNHASLLQNLSESVEAFYADLTAGGKENDVLSMTVSEFGRRVQQNGSEGTDHGMAAPLMMFGPALAGNGLIGDHPDLVDLDNGNLKYGIDFKQVYATVLKDWLCLPETDVDDIMGGNYNSLNLGFDCATTSSYIPRPVERTMQIRYGVANVKLYYHLESNEDAYMDISNLAGQRLHSQRLDTGSEYIIPIPTQNMAKGLYVCTIRQTGEIMSKKFVVK